MFLDGDDLAAMAANGTVLVPTLSVWDDWLFYGREMDWPATRIARAEGLRESSRAAIAGALRASVRIAAGTDAGGGSVRHGRIAREVELMIDCGMEPAVALQAATREGARLMVRPTRAAPSKSANWPIWCCSTATRSRIRRRSAWSPPSSNQGGGWRDLSRHRSPHLASELASPHVILHLIAADFKSSR